MKEDQLFWIEKTTIILAAIFSIGSLYYTSFKLTLSIVLGFLIVQINFWLLRRIVFGLIRTQPKKAKLLIGLALKYILLFSMLGAAIFYFNLHVIGLLVGISTLVVAIVLLGVKEAF